MPVGWEDREWGCWSVEKMRPEVSLEKGLCSSGSKGCAVKAQWWETACGTLEKFRVLRCYVSIRYKKSWAGWAWSWRREHEPEQRAMCVYQVDVKPNPVHSQKRSRVVVAMVWGTGRWSWGAGQRAQTSSYKRNTPEDLCAVWRL